MAGDIDYRGIDVPEGKPPEAYTFGERRAAILRRVEDVGSPRMLNGAALAREFGVARSTIHHDFDRLAEYVDGRTGKREALDAESIYWRCIRELLDAGEPRKAAQTLSDYHGWLHDRAELDDLWAEVEALRSAVEGATERDTERSPFQLK